jgi:HK97 family phage prohead protease
MKPHAKESRDDFIDRCIGNLIIDRGFNDADTAIAIAQDAWRQSQKMLHTKSADGVEFVLSDETPDRMGDILKVDGWVLDSFLKNPIALLNHRSDQPIGLWSSLRVEGKALRGKLQLAPEGTSDRIDEVIRLVRAGILKAVSVGFRELESRRREGVERGLVFTKQELVETSLVSVPANPNALAIARAGVRFSERPLARR